MSDSLFAWNNLEKFIGETHFHDGGCVQYEEANITHLIDPIENEAYYIDSVTIRRYPRSYIIAYQLELHDDPGYEYTLDGDGCGIVPVYEPRLVIWKKMPRQEYDADPEMVIQALRNHLKARFEGGDLS